jgi:hypothetical protein
VALPPVALVQIGDFYFVLDGHHRISVAQAYGQRDIEARVTAWRVSGPLPWEASTAAPCPPPVACLTPIARLASAVRQTATLMGERIRASLQRTLKAVGPAFRARHARDTKELLWT